MLARVAAINSTEFGGCFLSTSLIDKFTSKKNFLKILTARWGTSMNRGQGGGWPPSPVLQMPPPGGCEPPGGAAWPASLLRTSMVKEVTGGHSTYVRNRICPKASE